MCKCNVKFSHPEQWCIYYKWYIHNIMVEGASCFVWGLFRFVLRTSLVVLNMKGVNMCGCWANIGWVFQGVGGGGASCITKLVMARKKIVYEAGQTLSVHWDYLWLFCFLRNTHQYLVLAERVTNESMEQNPGSSWDLNPRPLNTSQTLLPLTHLDPWQRTRRQVSHISSIA